MLGERLERAAEAPSLLRIVLQCCVDEERPDDTEDDSGVIRVFRQRSVSP